LQTAADELFDLALLDININSEPVFDVADRLKDRGIPFVFVTGYGMPGLPERFQNHPLCQKPFSTRQLVGALAGVLDR
jgi:CheY-like chemotaxis protein